LRNKVEWRILTTEARDCSRIGSQWQGNERYARAAPRRHGNKCSDKAAIMARVLIAISKKNQIVRNIT
jgi:hypothetical protein